MKKLKYLLYGLLSIVLLLLIAAIFLTKEYSFTVEKKVRASKQVVYNLLASLEQRNQWDPVAFNPDYILEENGENDNFIWTTNEGHQYELRIVSSSKDSMIVFEQLNRNRDRPDTIIYKIREEENDYTGINVNFHGRSSWPRNLINFHYRGNDRKKVYKELASLEEVSSERQNSRIYSGYKMVEGITKERNFVTRRGEVSSEKKQQFYLQNLGVLFSSINDAGLSLDGMPCGLFYTDVLESSTLDMAAAIPVYEEVEVLGAESQNIKTSKAIVVDYYGDSKNTIKAHRAIQAYVNDNGYSIQYPIVEEYVTDTTIEEDPNKWLTRITYYMKVEE